MRKLVQGVGINNADYDVNPSVNGKRKTCPIYSRWNSMLTRCYSKRKHETQPTYIGCSVCKEWLTFSNFKKWMESLDWTGKDLDKDLLVSGNKIYSPESCIFVSGEINTLTTSNGARRGAYPIGVSFDKFEGKLVSNINIRGRNKKLGRFLSVVQAHAAWQKAKIAVIREAAGAESDESLVSALHRIADKVQSDLDAGIETTHY